MNKKISYDEINDILYVHKGKKEADSLPIGDFIVEFTHRNKIVGLEILNATKNLSVMSGKKISSKDLNSIIDANISLYESKNMSVIILKLQYVKKEQKIKEQITINMPSKVPKIPA